MTSVKTSKARRYAMLSMFSVLALSGHGALSLELATVLSNSTISPPSRVAFQEERHIQMMKEPMVLTGYLEYLAPGRLRKVIETPFDEVFIVEPGSIIIEAEGQVRKIGGAKSRSLKTMMSGIEAILAGQADQLESVFDYQLSGTESDWSLTLTPISKRIAKQLTALQVAGDDQAVTSIRFDFSGGDWHQMDILRNDPEP